MFTDVTGLCPHQTQPPRAVVPVPFPGVLTTILFLLLSKYVPPYSYCNKTLIVTLPQVSHHPPISAFYVECAARRISFNGHIYTKSSFLGMSVAVHNVGEGRITLMDHGEDYVATFPSGYGRSILTTPWLELGGKVGRAELVV